MQFQHQKNQKILGSERSNAPDPTPVGRGQWTSLPPPPPLRRLDSITPGARAPRDKLRTGAPFASFTLATVTNQPEFFQFYILH